MKYDFARRQMVEQQVRAWDVLDPGILDVMAAVPREQFVPAGYQSLAFADMEIPLGHGQVMMTPTVEGRLLQSLGLAGDQQVLEIGTGSGFLCACLAGLAGSVTSVDIFEDFVESAQRKLEHAGIANVELLHMDATRELPGRQFDAIAVTGSIRSFDPRFVMALKPGGRLFVVVGSKPIMEARLVTRSGEHDWQSQTLFETVVAPLVNAALPPGFVF
jgi:protein-L-isoaspartate(D-aspartate) O-methyltransferase